jgi:RNA ligase (TIGR02306 family)
MAGFAVTIESIKSTQPIPDADRIEVASLAGMDFEFVVPKGQFRPGDPVLYFPVDSVLPAPLIERLGLTGRLAGKDKNRVKTLTLRGQISQGLVAALEMAPARVTEPAALTAALGVTKYEPPESICSDGVLTRLPTGQGKYDIESADRYVAVATLLLDQPVYVTEKVEGSNLWGRCEPDGTVTVGQRENTITPREGVEHTFHLIARRTRLVEFAQALAAARAAPVVVYAEALGPKIQGNIYNLKTHTARLFDVRVGPEFLAPVAFLDAVRGFFGGSELVVPVLQPPDGTTLRGWLAGRSIKEASNGTSRLAERLREGIVIKPATEARHPELGRLVLKQRSPQYLAKSDY